MGEDDGLKDVHEVKHVLFDINDLLFADVDGLMHLANLFPQPRHRLRHREHRLAIRFDWLLLRSCCPRW